MFLPLAINLNENWMYTVLVQSRSLETSILSPSCKYRTYSVNLSSRYQRCSAAYYCLDVVCYWLLVAAREVVLCPTPSSRQKMGTVIALAKWAIVMERARYGCVSPPEAQLHHQVQTQVQLIQFMLWTTGMWSDLQALTCSDIKSKLAYSFFGKIV